jgi:hypothetical protein
LASGILVAKNFDTDEADGTGDAVAIEAEIFPSFVGYLVEIHFDAGDNFEEVEDGELIFCDEMADGNGEGRLIGGGGEEGIFPSLEGESAVFDGVAWVIGDVIDDPAPGVEDRDIVASVFGEGNESESEV